MQNRPYVFMLNKYTIYRSIWILYVALRFVNFFFSGEQRFRS
jgi:hypothetical protein